MPIPWILVVVIKLSLLIKTPRFSIFIKTKQSKTGFFPPMLLGWYNLRITDARIEGNCRNHLVQWCWKRPSGCALEEARWLRQVGQGSGGSGGGRPAEQVAPWWTQSCKMPLVVDGVGEQGRAVLSASYLVSMVFHLICSALETFECAKPAL